MSVPKKATFSTVKSVGRMRFNKNEVASLASQPSHKFEKEGVLFVKERQEGFFRRTEKTSSLLNRSLKSRSRRSSLSCYGGMLDRVSVERWCRLRGNLLFYFKSRDHWSEPAGVIIIEDCSVEVETSLLESTFGIILKFGGGLQQHLATYTEQDRDAWTVALKSASHRTMKAHLQTLKQKIQTKLYGNPALASSASSEEISSLIAPKVPSVIDPSEAPIVEISLSCDNLLCDALGRAPSARLVIHTRNPPEILWKRVAQTEIAEKSSNPAYLRTIQFRASEHFSDKTEVRITALDFRERFTSTATQLGKAHITIDQLKTGGRSRLKLESPNPEGRNAGFVTLNAWTFEVKVPGSTDSTPYHTNKHGLESAKDLKAELNNGHAADFHGRLTTGLRGHRRSQSLPPDTHQLARLPQHKSLGMIFANPIVKTYRFHSGLCGDIDVQELMAESKLSFTFPQQLLSLWICEEKELVHEIAGLGELKSPWHECQMTWLENHLNLINTYSQALENLDNHRPKLNFRKSTQKSDKTFEFVPTNLHLQRMWVQNESLRKSGFYDTFTHGAFTAMAQKSPGLIKMLKDLKAPQKDSNAWCSQSDRLQMAEDMLAAVRRVRKEVVDCMRVLMKQGKEKRSDGMFAMVEDMLRKTKCLCSLMDQGLVEEAFVFLEDNRIAQRPERDEFSESVSEFMQRNKLKIDLPLFRHNKFENLQTPCTEFLSKELRTPDVDMFSPTDPMSSEFWRTYSAYTSGYQSVDRLSDIDEFEESFKYLSVVDKTRHYYTLCRTGSPIDTPSGSPRHLPTPKRSQSQHSMRHGEDKVHSHHEDEGIGRDEVSNGNENMADDLYSEDEGEFRLHGVEDVLNAIEEIEEDHSEDCLSDDEVEFGANESLFDASEFTTQNETNKDTPQESPRESPAKAKANLKEQPVANTGNNKVTLAAPHPQPPKKDQNDQNLTSDSPSGLHYRSGDEPEPIDLTHLNIEAAMMCLASKIRMLCGKANSPTLSSRTFRFKELDMARQKKLGSVVSSIPKSASLDSAFKIPDVPRPQESPNDIEDWTSELRPSMRKLRQGMDSLCKTSRLVCSVLRLQQSREAVNLSHDIKYRRDVCFSQALTTLTSSLMAKFWTMEPDPAFLHICAHLGPLVAFESLVTIHGDETAMFNDMVVAVEDLRNVEFTLILVDKRAKAKARPLTPKPSGQMPILPYHSFPLPRVTGSRCSLKVLLPVPDYVYTMLPLDKIKTMTFSITPVFFNVGINQNAYLAGRFGNNGLQEKNNLDNFKILQEYHRRFKKLDLPQVSNMPGSRTKRLSVSGSNEPQLEDLLAILKNEVNNRKIQNVEILHLASAITRRLQGIRFINCKSGKDRTGMAATLEQVQILSRDYDLAENEYKKALDVMRCEGTRCDNVLKNIGDKRYAFNTIQLTAFPYQYRPPVGSYGSKVT
ncbi:inositol polyphosphate-4-phosphatase type I A-like isoform X1 [Tigriopus californicus]|uniref:inositol polyphosphate-4-phosphatase type I A-like isoform X1 n=2 Tax=Tigriopus californicus TaxID=6832 RepID=UPI0027D9E8E1|nr:inositol polyphosphate-4-phosphatase type I A-like isoform X1 [Tigriopus californicus]